jgi:hypothetical protein
MSAVEQSYATKGKRNAGQKRPGGLSRLAQGLRSSDSSTKESIISKTKTL